MSEASLRRRRSFFKRGSTVDRPVHTALLRRSQQPRKNPTSKTLPRSGSEPLLWIVQLVPDDVISESDKEDPPLFINPTFYSCSDIFEPSPQVQALPRLLHPSEVSYTFIVQAWTCRYKFEPVMHDITTRINTQYIPGFPI
jgi:hypothetical protein